MKLSRGTGIFLVELLNHQESILYIRGQFPSALVFFVAFPGYQILELSPINTRSYHIVYFIPLIVLLRDMNWTRLRHGLTRERP